MPTQISDSTSRRRVCQIRQTSALRSLKFRRWINLSARWQKRRRRSSVVHYVVHSIHPFLYRVSPNSGRRFGGFWPGGSLGSAVEQFFGHGGKRVYVIRVANSARGAMVCLPALHGVLVLRAVEPGSTERIRVAVDYDGISGEHDTLFNLTLQRVESDSGLILDQEIYRRLSCEAGKDNFVEDVLLGSSMVRVQGSTPDHRPASTGTDYVEHAQAGTDGLALSDYDLVGSASRGTGLFAHESDRTF